MLVYSYHPETYRYTGSEEADPDPKRLGQWIIPDYCTSVLPPVIQENQYIVFNEQKQVWIICEYPAIPYYELRRRSYPSIYDYIDGIVKNDQDQIDKYIEQCREVKATYPKPEIEYEI